MRRKFDILCITNFRGNIYVAVPTFHHLGRLMATMFVNKEVILIISFLSGCVCALLQTIPEGPNIWIKNGRPINISCLLITNRTSNITWLKNGHSFVTTQDLTTEVVYIDAYVTTKLTLYTKNSEFNDSGTYTCTDGNSSKSVQVSVIKGKIKIRPLKDRIVTFVNDTISLICEYEGNVKLDSFWMKDDVIPIENLGFTNNRRSLVGRKITTTSEVTKRDLTSRDAGEYFCHAGPFVKRVSLEVYQGLCNNSLLTGTFGVADDHITASSYYKDVIYSDIPSRVRLNTVRETKQTGQNRYYGGAWAPNVNDKNQWIQVKLQKLSVVKQIVTQGRSSTDCCAQEHWVKTFKLLYSQDNITWSKYKDSSGNSMVFSANYDHNTYRVNQLPVPVIAQYIQINPVSWNQRIAMRLDIIGCFIPSDIRIIEPKTNRLSLEIPAPLHLSCQFVGPDMPSIAWYKDGRDISKSVEFIRRSVTSEIDGQISVLLSVRKLVTHYSDSGHYTCQDANLKLNKTLTVHIAKLKMQPKSGQYWAMSSKPLNITCTYNGADSQDVNWNYNGEIPVFRKRLDTRSDDNGVHSISGIYKSKAVLSDSGNYSCTVGDFKRTMILRVIEVSTTISSHILKVGDSVTFGCGVFGVPIGENVNIYWSKQHKPIKDIASLKNRYTYHEHTKTLIIHKTELSDSGTYECNVVLSQNSTYKQRLFETINLLATPKAKIEGQKTIQSGDSLHLYCKTEGYPKPHIVWYRGEKKLDVKTSRITFLPYAGSPNGHLVVFDVSIEDADEYSCQGVANGFTPIKSSMDVEVNQSEEDNNIVLIIVIVVCSVSLIVTICFVALCIRCRSRRRAMTKSPDALETLARNRPQITKMYVDMHASRRPKRSVSEEEIRMLPRAPAPIADATSLNTYRSDEGSATYESFRHSTENTTIKEPVDIR